MRNGLLHVLPDRERVEEELLLGLGPAGYSLGAHLLTLQEFFDLFTRDELTLCDRLTARVLLGECAARVDMGPYKKVARRPAFLRAVQQTIESLKAGRCWADELRQGVEKLPDERAARLLPVVRLYEEYEDVLESRKLCDAPDALAAVLRTIKDRARPLPPQLAETEWVVFEDVYDWPPLKLEILLALAARLEAEGRGQRLRVVLPHDPERPDLMAFVDPVYEELYRRAQDGGALEIVTKTYGQEGSAPARLARSLFRTPAPPWDGEPAVQVVSAPTPAIEARELARRVRVLLDRGEPPESIAVALRQLDEGAELLLAALERYGVPVRLRRSTTLADCAIADLAVALATCRHDEHPREALESLLASGYPRKFADDAGAVLRALRESGARSDRDAQGLGGWARALETLEARRERLRQRSHGLGTARRAVAALLGAAEKLPAGAAPVSAHAQGLLAALQALGALQPGSSEAARKATLASPEALKALAREQAATGALVEAVEHLARSFELAGRKEEVLAPAFAELLRDALNDVSLPPRGPRGGAVALVEVKELVGRKLQHLFLAGLVDGRFPMKAESAPLLSDDDKARLNKALGRTVFRLRLLEHGPMPDKLAEEPLLFHLAMASAAQGVTLTWHRVDEGGKECLPSRFLEEVQRVKGAAAQSSLPLLALPKGEDALGRQELIARAALEREAPRGLRASREDHGFDAEALWGLFAKEEPARARSLKERIAAERERFVFFARPDAPPGPFSGALPEPVANQVAAFLPFDEQHPLSPKQLNDLGNCRFKGLATLVLKLRGEEEAESHADAATRGDLYHRAMHAFMLERQGAHRLPLKADADDLEALNRAIDEAARSIEGERHIGHPALWELTVEEARLLLARVVRAEAKEPVFAEAVAWKFELAIGEGEVPFLKIPGPDGEAPLAVHGRIDRIDRGPEFYGAVDYKTGRLSSISKRLKDTFLKSEFQLALYTAALKSWSGVRGDAAFVSLKDAKSLRLSEALVGLGLDPSLALAIDPGVRRQVREQTPEQPTLGDAVWGVVKDAREGRFPVRPIDCRYCDFAAVCRVGGGVQMEEGGE